MKKVIIYAITLFSAFSYGVAQQSVEPQKMEQTKSDYSKFVPVNTNMGSSKAAATEQEYEWQSMILRRLDEATGADSNRRDMNIPLNFGSGTEFRGFGQAFNPQAVYNFYNKAVYNENSNIIKFPDPNKNDQVWIDQFKDAKSDFRVDSVRFFVYKNPNSAPTNSGKILALKARAANMVGATYKKNGLTLNRATLSASSSYFEGYKSVIQLEVTPDDMDAKITPGEEPGSFRIQSTAVAFDPPLKAKSTDAVIIMYVNDDAPALEQPLQENDEYQRMIATDEYRSDDGNEGTNPLDTFMSMSVVLFKQGTTQSILSTWKGLIFRRQDGTTIRSYINMNMNWFGAITLPTGVEYHFGHDVKDQGLKNVVPAPVVTGKTSRQHFTVVERTQLTLQLFDAEGKLVKTLIDNQDYIPGNYSVALPVEEMQSGNYLVSMRAGNKIYTGKVSVSK